MIIILNIDTILYLKQELSEKGEKMLWKSAAESGALVLAAVDREAYGETSDQMLAEGKKAGNSCVQRAIDTLVKQTKTIEKAVSALDLKSIASEEDDSLDNPKAVFQ